MPRIFEASVTLGLAATLALAAATSSFAQTRQNSPRNAPAAQAQPGNPAAEQSGQCWISSEDNDRGNFGYWGPCSNPKARQVR
jgi:hypothetical protein